MKIDALVEGVTDELLANEVIRYCGHEVGVCFGKRGCNYIINKLNGFSVRARHGEPLLVLIDFMDTRLECERDLVTALLRNRPPRCLLRGVVRELESWLLADAEAVAEFLGISTKRVPANPEQLADPKQSLVNLARRCKNRARREGIVPASGVSASVGPDYTGEIGLFITEYWKVARAQAAAPSLSRCVRRLQEVQ